MSSDPQILAHPEKARAALAVKPLVAIRAMTVAGPLDLYNQDHNLGLAPEPYETVSAWADEHRYLDSKSSSEPGRWRTSRTPYLREIMDCLSPHSLIMRTVFVKGAQLGGTECGNNWMGYVVHRAPGPMLLVQPTLLVAKRVSKQRIAPMIESTPVLRERIRQSRSRDAGNTTFEKEFDGGLLILTGANSSAGLRSMPIRYLFCDEVDEYPGDVEGQGDPVSLAEKRTATYARRKIFLVSTPTIKDFSRIEKEYLATDQRRYFVPCPHCGHMDYLQWSAGGWKGGEGIHHHLVFDSANPDGVHLECSKCASAIEERYKTQMLAGGEWRPTAESKDKRTAGFHLSTLYSPLGWKSWAEIAKEFLESKTDSLRLKTWVNTMLGETWEEQGDSVEPHVLLARTEHYAAEVPVGVGAIVGSVDVQHDRLEAKVVGYGEGEESWLIAATQLYGDPGHSTVWLDLDAFMKGPWKHVSGKELPMVGYSVDSGGHHTEHVYRYCDARRSRRVFCIRGGSVQGAPLVSAPSRKNRYRLKLFTLGVNTGKDMVTSRMKIARPGPGYMHLPNWIDKEYAEQMTAERSVRKYVKGKGTVREWVKIRERNEQFDLEVYALATLHILGPALIKRLKEMARAWAVESGTTPDAEVKDIPEPPATNPEPIQPLNRLRGNRRRWTIK